MQIISHRGYWKSPEQKNTRQAFLQSFEPGFGTETDIRDRNGILVISHDMPDETCITVDDFFTLVKDFDKENAMPLALNIKADGLQQPLLKLIAAHDIRNYFLFDMSVPDLKTCMAAGLNVYTRLSEYEKDCPFYDKAKGIWLDAFENTWYDEQLIAQHTSAGKTVCIVSAELHKRDHIAHWNELKEMGADNWHKEMILCTDFPELANSFFSHE